MFQGGSQGSDHGIHQDKVRHAAQDDKDVEDLVAAKAGVVPAGPLDRVEHPAHGVEHPPAISQNMPAAGRTRDRGAMANRAIQPMAR